jgi:hypothetical protein
MHHIEIVGGFTEVKHSWSLRGIHYFIVYIHLKKEAKFQLEVSKNRDAIFFPSKFTNPYRP